MNGLRVYEGVKLVKLGGFVVFYYICYMLYYIQQYILNE